MRYPTRSVSKSRVTSTVAAVGVLILVVLALCDQPLAANSSNADGSDWIQTILRHQQAHFKRIRSIKFRGVIVREPEKKRKQGGEERLAIEQIGSALRSGPEKKRKQGGKKRGVSTRSDGSRKDIKWYAESGGRWFLRETVSYGDTTRHLHTEAWNGQKYQDLWSQQGERIFSTSAEPPVPADRGGIPGSALSRQYGFLSRLYSDRHGFVPRLPPDRLSHLPLLGPLQEWEPWGELMPMAVDCRKHTTWKGEEGATIVFRRPDGVTVEVFFAAAHNYLPWYWKGTRPGDVLPNAPREWEYEVKSAVSQDTPSGNVVIPVYAEMRWEGGGKETLRIDRTTLKLNVSLKDGTFTIPDSIEYYHETDRGAVRQPAAVTAEDAGWASAIIRGIYEGHLRGVTPGGKAREAYTDAVIGPVGEELRARFGTVEGVQMADRTTTATHVDTVWTVTAEQETFEMKTRYGLRGRLTRIWFHFPDNNEWTPLEDM